MKHQARLDRGWPLLGLQIKQITLPMWSGLPEIAVGSQREVKDSSKEKKPKQATPPKVSYRGITLKEYFRLCEEARPNDSLRQIKEESRADSAESIAETPTFQQQEASRPERGKFKTQVCEVEPEGLRVGRAEEGRKGGALSLEKGQKSHYMPLKKKEERKKIYTKANPTPKEHPDLLNRSTLNSFYQIEENKKRMLKKIQLEKERVHDMRLSEAFFITKYGSRFRIEPRPHKE